MSMSKKDFVALADALRTVEMTDSTLSAILSFCHNQNSAFKQDRWLSYLRGDCGPSGGKIK